MYEYKNASAPQYVEQRHLHLDLIGETDEVRARLQALLTQLGRIASNPSVIQPLATPNTYAIADDSVVAERVAEAAGSEVTYITSELEQGFIASETIRAARGVAAYFTSIVVGDHEMSIQGTTLAYDADGTVVRCDTHSDLQGVNILRALACFIRQDFGTVIARDGVLRYIFESSVFEKTPKDVDSGKNAFLGHDFLAWHRPIPTLGPLLAETFQAAYDLFCRDALDVLLVDLRGRNLYTDGRRVIRRFERDYVVPLRDETGRCIGMNVFADLFISDINSMRSPFSGGPYLQITLPNTFNAAFRPIKHSGFRPHPSAPRSPLPESGAALAPRA